MEHISKPLARLLREEADILTIRAAELLVLADKLEAQGEQATGDADNGTDATSQQRGSGGGGTRGDADRR